jgi:hypothetical protein
MNLGLEAQAAGWKPAPLPSPELAEQGIGEGSQNQQRDDPPEP